YQKVVAPLIGVTQFIPCSRVACAFNVFPSERCGFCQVVEAEALIKRAGASPKSYLSFRRPAPYLSLQPNSRIDSASLDDIRPLIAKAVWVGSVGRWAHRQTENAGHAPGI